MVYLVRGLFSLCLVAILWAHVIVATGGFFLHAGPFRLSSRNPVTAVSIALLSGLTLILLRFVPSSRTTVENEWTLWTSTFLSAVRRVSHCAGT